MNRRGNGQQPIADVVLIHDGGRHAHKLAASLRQRFMLVASKLGQSSLQDMPSGRMPVFSLAKIGAAELSAIKQSANRFSAKPIFVFRR